MRQIDYQQQQILQINLQDMCEDLNPSCNYKHCRSFFQISFQEMKWNKSHLSFLPTLFNIEDDVVYLGKKQQIKRRAYKLLDQYLFYKNKNEKIVWINYENAIIELITNPELGMGIRLTKCFDKIEFFGNANNWYKFMKRFAVQYNFSNYYIINTKLNKIKFGEIFKGKNKLDGQEYIIKIYQKSLIIDDEDRQQFLKEISVIRQLKTDLTLKFYDLFENQDQIYVIIENLPSHTLLDYVLKNPFFSEDKAAKVIFRIIKIIAYLHSKKIMHRDIKLENFIFRQLDNLDSLCLIDFKLAEFYDDEGHYQFKRCGTVGYVAPEVLADKNYDLKVDIYSVGILLFILFTGKEPFDGNYQEKLIQNLIGFIDFHNLRVSNLASDFLKGLLRLDPQERLSSHQALNHKWFQREKLIGALKQQIKSTLQNLNKSYKVKASFKKSFPILPTNSIPHLQDPISFRMKTLPNPQSYERVHLPVIQRRTTHQIPSNSILYGRIK
ncbi:unnamed protein product [Paramecium primaurelia]|uniref:Protein kinase domain-containing protein n=1 Tax=Paramecium primaurelia TaxID=5886 RepID=A0A8S1K4F6_PARPR|nr:unnamed protein product [Paramecium primaurelia]